MTTKSLEYFLVVVKHLNISRAAEELYISQPALSKQIRLLEEELGVTLFDRSNHTLKLTTAGEVLIHEANDLFRKQSELVERVRAAGNISGDTLTICHMPGALNCNVPSILSEFQKRYPQISLKLPGSSPSQIFSDLLNHKIDAGIILSATTNYPEPLQALTMHQAQLYLAVPEGHNYASFSSISFHDISDETLLMLSEQEAPAQHSLLPFFLHGNHNQTNNQILYQPNMETIVSMIRTNMGIAFIARDYCSSSLEGITLIPIQDSFDINLFFIWNPQYMTPQLKELKKMMQL